MRALFALVLSIAFVAPAAAALAPQYYEQARDEAPNVIIILVQHVEPPAEGIGWCVVQGTVARVDRGSLYTEGQAVSINVDCMADDVPWEKVPVGGTQWQDLKSLQKSTYGRAFLSNEGTIMLSQYDIL